MGTVAPKRCRADRLSGSDAVTVISTSPLATPVTVMTLPDTDAVTTPSSEVSAVKLSESPSGSSKCALRSTAAESPGFSSRGGIESSTIGGWLGTVAPKRCRADRPSGSDAVTVISTSPLATPVTVMTLPDTDAVTTPSSEFSAVKLSESPSGSSKYALRSTAAAGIAGIQFQGGIESSTIGGWLGTVAAEALPGG